VPTISEDQCLTKVGIVSDVYKGGKNDVVIRLNDIDQFFYINRGLEQGLPLSSLRADLIGRKVTLIYPNHWTPLDPFQTTHHLSKVEMDQNVIFSAFND